jgi:APA family basic amino acid/polyamine antiporter
VPKLSLIDAVFIGLASMLGAGVFIVFGFAANLAGHLLPLSILLAALVAYLNAGSVAQLASVITRSGGGYAYGRQYLSKTLGYLAGFSFLIGKIGSSAVIAQTVALYLFPSLGLAAAIGAVVVMTIINLLGINRTALGSKVLALITIGFLITLIFSAIGLPSAASPLGASSPPGVLSAAALFFFAFAGYARVATLGGEVKDSAKTVPLAIWLSLAIVLLIYLSLSLILMSKLGGDLAKTITPLADLSSLSLSSGQIAGLFAAIAGLGSLLALLAGMSRTAAEMGFDSELPKFMSKRLANGAPYVAEILIALGVVLLVVSGNTYTSLGISSFCVLAYYAIINWSAFRQPKAESARPKYLSLLGFALCLFLALSVPLPGLINGAALLVIALGLRWGLRALS